MFQEIIYEDDSVIVVNKNPGIAVVSGRGIKDSEILCKYLEQIRGIKIFTVHRLDRETSGVIILAKTAKAHRNLCLQFEKRETEKTYLAVVSGKPGYPGSISEPIYQFGSGRMGVDKRGKKSQTNYFVEKEFRSASLLKLHPITGRRHQIRVHMYHIGHPVLGDRIYGFPRPVGNVSRLMLHAHTLTVKLEDGIKKTFCASTDSQWNAIMERLQSETEVCA
jgi:tRNA pseudouridine32 synthase/23S rRNA pseudouridine746 synthase